ncbi:MAG: DUF1295 domain-containing protein [Acetobacteraceae bacterium]|nr:DUF1295 domain-containing protein [Acetobacteraceae bacterium]
MIPLLLAEGVGLSLAMAGAWWFQRRMRNAGWVDVVWTFATGTAAVIGALWPSTEGFTPRRLAVAALAAAWAMRLGLHLRARVMTRPEDRRYAGFRVEWGSDFEVRLFWFLQIQAAAAWPLAIAMTVAARNPAASFGVADFAALVVIVVSVLGAGIADRQLARFVSDPGNKGRVCDSGLWTWSRHPNYFLEFLGWCAWPLFAFNLDWPWWWLALPAPVLMYWLLVHVSGIPPLEKAMLETRGDAYRAYQRRTRPLLPLPIRRKANP